MPKGEFNVIEVGSLNINGSVRELAPDADWYGIDIVAGPDVDEVADGATWTPVWTPDVVVCCEVFEHTPDWATIIGNMASWLPLEGQMILTCAGPGRAPHSAVDGGPLREGEWYENIDPNRMSAVLREHNIVYTMKLAGGDLYVHGYKN